MRRANKRTASNMVCSVSRAAAMTCMRVQASAHKLTRPTCQPFCLSKYAHALVKGSKLSIDSREGYVPLYA